MATNKNGYSGFDGKIVPWAGKYPGDRSEFPPTTESSVTGDKVDIKAASGMQLAGGSTTVNVTSNGIRTEAKQGEYRFGNILQRILGLNRRDSQDEENFVRGDHVTHVGDFSTKAREAAEKINDIRQQAVERGIEAAAKAKPVYTKCPTCSCPVFQDNVSESWIYASKASETLSKMPYVGPFITFLIDISSFFLGKLDLVSSGSLKKSKSCGPGCKNNQYNTGAGAIGEFEKTAIDHIDKHKDEINRLHREMGSGGNYMVSAAQGVHIHAGLAINRSPTVLDTGTFQSHPTCGTVGERSNGGILIHARDGAIKKVASVTTPALLNGDISLTATEKIKIIAGSPGVETITTGPISFKGSTLNIETTDGEAHFGGANMTVLKGACLKLIGKSNDGGGSIVLDSDRVLMNGGAFVTGNFGVKGELAVDGAIKAPALVVPGVRQTHQATKPTQMATGGSNSAIGSQLMRFGSWMKDIICKYILPPTWILDTDNLFSAVQEKIDAAKASSFVDMVPAGFAIVINTGVGWGYCSYGGLVGVQTSSWSIGAGVFPPTFAPVWLFYHNHSKFSMDTVSTSVAPMGIYTMTDKGMQAHRSGPTHIPTPAPVVSNLGPRPGPSTIPGPCGGGGLYTKMRDQSYGLNPDDPYDGKNYIDLYPEDHGDDQDFIKRPSATSSEWLYRIKSTPLSGIKGVDNCDEEVCPPIG